MDSLANAALRQLIIATKIFIRLVKLIVRSISQIFKAAKARDERPNVAEMRPPERKG